MIAYLDTHVAAWLAQGQHAKLSAAALAAVEQFSLRISPMVLLEFEYLFESKRTLIPATAVLAKLSAELDVEVCGFPFVSVARQALAENWTRDPFDRMIVAQARANGVAPLLSADRLIREHYPNAVWDPSGEGQ